MINLLIINEIFDNSPVTVTIENLLMDLKIDGPQTYMGSPKNLIYFTNYIVYFKM